MSRTREHPVVLSASEREALERTSRSRVQEARRVRRAKVLLMAADGATDKAIAQAVGLNRNSVRNTIAKCLDLGALPALDDRPRTRRSSKAAEAKD